MFTQKGTGLTHSNNTDLFYDVIAEYYPYFYRDWETQLEREGLGLRAIFRNQGVKRVLDASCGIGIQAVPLAQMGYDVVAADPSAGMLRKAHEIAEQYNVQEKIRFERANFLTLPEYVDGQFDAVITKGTALPHLLYDDEIEQAIKVFWDFLRPGGTLVIGMRDFGPFMEARPRFIPGFVHDLEDKGELITFEIWEWDDGPPLIAKQKLYIVQSEDGKRYTTKKRWVDFRPLSTDEVKVVLLEAGFVDYEDRAERTDRIIITRKPL
ncbi:MAG: class I SAM-dependent methyltransferase [Chloroflexota bacterium]